MSSAEVQHASRREMILGAATAGLACIARPFAGAACRDDAKQRHRIGIVNAGRGNGHTWHFFQGFHEAVDMNALQAYQGKELAELYSNWLRNPHVVGPEPPFGDTRISHVFDKDPQAARHFAAVFTGARPVDRVEKMIHEVDAVLLGDDIGDGKDHQDRISPALEAGLPTFCDKPLADTPRRAREIIALAEKHKAPLMSSSLFRHFAVVQNLAKLRQTGDAGPLRWLTVGYSAACTDDFLPIYGIHPIWAVVAMAGVGIHAVSQVRHAGSGLLTVTYKDRSPATIWMGGENRSTAHFANRTATVPLFGLDDGKEPWHARYAKTIAHFARAIREMIVMKRSPIAAQELLEVVAATHAAIRSGREKSRLVALSEVL